eukprot:Lankesteria_metandrocarpae@DN5391_c0_g1_i2.p1
MANVVEPEAILEFWSKQPRQRLFNTNVDFDEEIRTLFGATLITAKDGKLEHWRLAPRSMLAYIILHDQFSRNLHRGSKEMYAADSTAVAAARHAVHDLQRFDQHDSISQAERMWFYMPFMHSEALEDQDLSVQLFTSLGQTQYAEEHRDTIKQFGRFPYRNEALGRSSTPEEDAYLAARKNK